VKIIYDNTLHEYIVAVCIAPQTYVVNPDNADEFFKTMDESYKEYKMEGIIV